MTAGMAANKSGGGGDQRFGDAGRDGAQGGAAGGAQSVEGVDDAPHRSEQADEGRDCARGRQPGQAALQAAQFFRGCDLRGALQRDHANGIRRLLAQFVISAFEDRDQRAGLELFGDGGDILQALRLAKGTHEAIALHARAPEQSPLGEDDGPRRHAEPSRIRRTALAAV